MDYFGSSFCIYTLSHICATTPCSSVCDVQRITQQHKVSLTAALRKKFQEKFVKAVGLTQYRIKEEVSAHLHFLSIETSSFFDTGFH